MQDSQTPDPQNQGEKPPFPQKPQSQPGSEKDMQLKPDYGLDTYKGLGRLKGKIALITGADSGIGRAIALAFAREEADVVINYNQSDQDAEETKKAIDTTERKGMLMKGDIMDETFCKSLIETVIKKYGELDILINNAAFQAYYESIEEIPSEEWDKAFKTNIYAMFYLSKAALPVMKKGGAIINTASIQAYKPRGSLLPYATTKGAIVTFTKALSQEAIKKGIRVNAVAPGPVWTPLIPASMPEENVKHFGEQTPIGRPAQPVEVAPLYVFLASQEARFVTGQVYGITGGEFLI